MKLTHTLTLPKRDLRPELIGKNRVYRLAEPGGPIGLQYLNDDGGAFCFVDRLGRRFAIFAPRVKAEHAETDCALRSRVSFDSPDQLQELQDHTLTWLAHPADNWPSTPEEIARSWRGAFRYAEEKPEAGLPGLREPQLGALHRIISHWSIDTRPATIVLPTGIGKTETMLATLVEGGCGRVLVVVPSDVLRTQLFRKFLTLGCLREIGAILPTVPLPRVGLLKAGIAGRDEATAFARSSNVIVATASILSSCSPDALEALTRECTHLFVDEAHHLGARTWEHIRSLFPEKPVLQFTATPFRRDGKSLGGTIIYNYPLGRAVERGYFKKIELCQIDELDDSRADGLLAEEAIRRLRRDRADGYDHLILARVKSIEDAPRVAELYQELAPEFAPVCIHSKLSPAERRTLSDRLATRASRILVCVDMFGEGFDFPQLKIAVMHDIHKSLPVTLQFIGRFTRTASSVGEAAAFVNAADPRLDKELQTLYSSGAGTGWTDVLRRSSEHRIEREIKLQELIQSFEGNLPTEVPLWNLRPSMSALAFRTSAASWTPDDLVKHLPTNEVHWYAKSLTDKTAVAVFGRRDDVKWGRYRELRDWTWQLVLIHFDESLRMLFLGASDYSALRCGNIARAVVGDSAELINGPSVFRLFHGVERPMVQNLGASKTGTVRYTMYFGPDVSVGLSQVEKAEAALNNVFGWGYEEGDRVTYGCSHRKGKLWSAIGGGILDWQDWCHTVGTKLANDGIQDADILKAFLRPEELERRPARIPVAVEWGEHVYQYDEARVRVRLGATEYSIRDVSLLVTAHTETGPVEFAVVAEDQQTTLRLEVPGPTEPPRKYLYHRVTGPEVALRMGSGEYRPFDELMEWDPIVVMYADGSFSYNQFFVDAAANGRLAQDLLEDWDWSGTNIRKESEGRERDSTSIQYKVAQFLLDDFEILFNDDNTGEIADLVALRRDGDHSVVVSLVHCKYSTEDNPGARVADFYQLCGQAQKCVRWKHAGFRAMVDHMYRRHQKWQDAGASRFIKGSIAELRDIEKAARRCRVRFDVTLVQPGLAKAKVDDELLYLLGSTDLFVKRTADATLRVVCSP